MSNATMWRAHFDELPSSPFAETALANGGPHSSYAATAAASAIPPAQQVRADGGNITATQKSIVNTESLN